MTDSHEPLDPVPADASLHEELHLDMGMSDGEGRIKVATLDRTVSIIETGVPGLVYAAASTAQSGLQVKQIDFRNDMPLPFTAEDTRSVSDVDSYLAEIDRRPLLDHSTLWANESAATVELIYDDHAGDHSYASHRRDRLRLGLVVDEDWTRLHELSGRFLGQEEFGDAIEELLHVIVAPDHADLMEVIESIRITTGGVFESAIRRSDGQQTLSYREDQTATAGRAQNLEIPQEITFAARRFEGFATRYEIKAWFRTRVVAGKLHLAFKLKPTRTIELAAWQDVRTAISEHTGRPVLLTR